MKIAVPSQDKERVADNFGRAGSFAVYDQKDQTFTYLDNTENLQAMQGAGVQTVSMLTQNGVDTVVASRIGPKAFEALKAGNIAVYVLPDNAGTVHNALAMFNRKELSLMENSVK